MAAIGGIKLENMARNGCAVLRNTHAYARSAFERRIGAAQRKRLGKAQRNVAIRICRARALHARANVERSMIEMFAIGSFVERGGLAIGVRARVFRKTL